MLLPRPPLKFIGYLTLHPDISHSSASDKGKHSHFYGIYYSYNLLGISEGTVLIDWWNGFLKIQVWSQLGKDTIHS